MWLGNFVEGYGIKGYNIILRGDIETHQQMKQERIIARESQIHFFKQNGIQCANNFSRRNGLFKDH